MDTQERRAEKIEENFNKTVRGLSSSNHMKPLKLLLNVISFLLVISGCFLLFQITSRYLTAKKASEEAVRIFMDDVSATNASHDNSSNPIVENQKPETEIDTQGVIKIDAINLTAPLADGTNPETLKKYAGRYQSLSSFGEGGVIGLAAHSTKYTDPCPYCYFQDIGSLQEGDIIQVLWKNKDTGDVNEYDYVVQEVNEEKTEVGQIQNMFYPINGYETLVLQTCTNGYAEYHTYVRARRTTDDK